LSRKQIFYLLVVSFLISLVFIFVGMNNFSLPVNKNGHTTLKIQTSQMGLKPWEHHAPYAAKVNFNSAVFNQLLYFDQSYNITPGLIRDWSWDEPSKSYILSIDSEFKFSDERPLRAEDIEFAILKRFITTKDETNRVFFKDILGTDKLKRGQVFKSGMCDGIKVLSEGKIRITLKDTNPTFLFTLGALTPAVAPIEDFDRDLLNFKNIPRGTGAYKVVWSDPDTTLVRLEKKNDDVSGPRFIEFFNHGSASSNNVDIATGGGIKDTKNDVRFKTYYGSIPTAVQVFDFNYLNKYGSDILFRKAISMILDRRAILGRDFMPAHELIPSSYYGRTNKKFEHDKNKGKKILEDNFPEILNTKTPLKSIFHGSLAQDGSLPRYLQVIKSQLLEAGLNVDFVSRDWTSFKDHEHDLYFAVYGMVTSFVDPLSAFAHYMPNSPFKNHTDINDRIATNLFDQASRASSIDDRAKLVKALSKHFQENYRQLTLEEIRPMFLFRDTISDLDDRNVLFSTIDFSSIEMR
jgi:oligopeptide transport system substrate-binding protein